MFTRELDALVLKELRWQNHDHVALACRALWYASRLGPRGPVAKSIGGSRHYRAHLIPARQVSADGYWSVACPIDSHDKLDRAVADVARAVKRSRSPGAIVLPDPKVDAESYALVLRQMAGLEDVGLSMFDAGPIATVLSVGFPTLRLSTAHIMCWPDWPVLASTLAAAPLTQLRINSCDVGDGLAMGAQFPPMARLRELDLRHNRGIGPYLGDLQLPSLETLDVSWCRVSPADLVLGLAVLPRLRRLCAAEARPDDWSVLWPAVASHPALDTLELSGGTIESVELGGRVRCCCLSDNRLTGDAVARILETTPQLLYLNVAGNPLTRGRAISCVEREPIEMLDIRRCGLSLRDERAIYRAGLARVMVVD